MEVDILKQAEMKEKRKKRNISGERRRCSPCNIFGTILKMGEEWTLTNEPVEKKANDDAESIWEII